jgi:hypothetical protein
LPTGFHNFVEIVREKEYSFSKCLLVLLPPIEGRYERGGRGSNLAQKGYLLWIKKKY